MANIKISDLQPAEFEFSELSDLELESVAGGKSNSTRNIIGGAIVIANLTGVLPVQF